MCGKRMMLVCAVAVSIGLAGVAVGQSVKQIQVTLVTGVANSFDADGGPTSDGLLTYDGGESATVLMDSGPPITIDDSNIDADFHGITRHAGADAKASFSDGTWSLVLTDDVLGDVLTIGGTLDWLIDEELSPDTLTARGHVVIDTDTFDYNTSVFGTDVEWGMGVDGKSGVTLQSTNIVPTPLVDFNSDFDSSSVTVIIYADSSNVVPEPVTMVMLAVGAVFGLIRRR